MALAALNLSQATPTWRASFCEGPVGGANQRNTGLGGQCGNERNGIVLVIGGGQAGLATGYSLRHKLDYRDCGTESLKQAVPGVQWLGFAFRFLVFFTGAMEFPTGWLDWPEGNDRGSGPPRPR